MKKLRITLATLLISSLASIAFAEEAKKKTTARGEKPKASPGWIVIEDDWSDPFLYDFSTSLHNAREHYRAKEDKSASADLDKAIAWLKYAQDRATKSTAEDLSTARYDLMDFSANLKSGKPVLAKKLDAAFADASIALAKHHHFQAGKSIADGDLKTAGRYVMAAADLLRNAAQSANLEYGTEAIGIYDDYAPYGYWDDTVVFEKSKLEANLSTVQNELEKIATKLKASK